MESASFGPRPDIKIAITAVIGADSCTSQEVLRRLQSRGWEPQSNDQLGYVAWTLSSESLKEDGFFAKVGRGVFCVRAKVARPTSWERLLELDDD
jgi:hypothetical protein